MPIATQTQPQMNQSYAYGGGVVGGGGGGGGGGSHSPTSPKISRAAFFRARSPPLTTSHAQNGLGGLGMGSAPGMGMGMGGGMGMGMGGGMNGGMEARMAMANGTGGSRRPMLDDDDDEGGYAGSEQRASPYGRPGWDEHDEDRERYGGSYGGQGGGGGGGYGGYAQQSHGYGENDEHEHRRPSLAQLSLHDRDGRDGIDGFAPPRPRDMVPSAPVSARESDLGGQGGGDRYSPLHGTHGHHASSALVSAGSSGLSVSTSASGGVAGFGLGSGPASASPSFEVPSPTRSISESTSLSMHIPPVSISESEANEMTDRFDDDEVTAQKRQSRRPVPPPLSVDSHPLPSTPGGSSVAEGSDEMLLTLLAGQAAVDCETMPVAGWEEVEGWKKELSILSNRLSSLQARYQREVKILTAARTLQKLNTGNKRMSKQTVESLEQSEKKVEAAEKEVLVLRDREASLRRQLMEHWAGVMAWEVRRLERVTSETQARFNRQSRSIVQNRDKEDALTHQVEELEAELSRRSARTEELEQMVLEMGRRERAIEAEVSALDEVRLKLEKEREGWEREREGWGIEKRQMSVERDTHAASQVAWESERRAMGERHQAVLREREALQGQLTAKASAPASPAFDPLFVDRVRASLSRTLGRDVQMPQVSFSGPDSDGQQQQQQQQARAIIAAVDELGGVVGQLRGEADSLREEVREVNVAMEEQVGRVAADRDAHKVRADRAEQGRREEAVAAQREIRAHKEKVSDLELRNESLQTSVQAAQTAVASAGSTSSAQSRALEARVSTLTSELDSIAAHFTDVWRTLPSSSARQAANIPGLAALSAASATPGGAAAAAAASSGVDVSALQRMYDPSSRETSEFGGIAALADRVRALIDDGRVMSERIVGMDKEKERHKANAAKAAKLVDDSRRNLETYQRQVAMLEDRLATTGSSESQFLEELNTLRASLDTAQSAKRQLEAELATHRESANRLEEANSVLSARALTLADDAENDKRALAGRLQSELEECKRKLEEAMEDADEQKTRGQAQRIQLLDELNSLQAEVADLRKQLRAVKR